MADPGFPPGYPGHATPRCRLGGPLPSGAGKEVVPGLWHWTARHDHIHVNVSSCYLLAERVLIDPVVPAEGLDWFERGQFGHRLLEWARDR
jgi:hypothetical protein